MISDKLYPFLMNPQTFFCELQPIKERHVRFCAHHLRDAFSLADETVVLYFKVYM